MTSLLSVAAVLDAVDEHLDADEPVSDVHRPGGVDGGGDVAPVQAQVVDGAVGAGQADHLVHREITRMLAQTLIQSVLQSLQVFRLEVRLPVLGLGVLPDLLVIKEDDSLVLGCGDTERVNLVHMMILLQLQDGIHSPS